MKKMIAFVAIVGVLYGIAGSFSLSSIKEATANAHQAREAAIEAATNGK